MSRQHFELLARIVRHPRHLVNDIDHVLIEMECARPSAGHVSYPDVIDFSRGGCRLRGDFSVEKHDALVVRITDTSNGLSLELPASVRWSRSAEGGAREAGCQFEEVIDYELLGELFLAGFLSTEECPVE